MYSVLFIYFDDDYKNTEDRYDVEIFISKEKADEYINTKLVDYIEQYFNEIGKPNQGLMTYLIDDDGFKIKEEFRNNRDVLDMIKIKYLSGQYIDNLISYELKEHTTF